MSSSLMNSLLEPNQRSVSEPRTSPVEAGWCETVSVFLNTCMDFGLAHQSLSVSQEFRCGAGLATGGDLASESLSVFQTCLGKWGLREPSERLRRKTLSV